MTLTPFPVDTGTVEAFVFLPGHQRYYFRDARAVFTMRRAKKKKKRKASALELYGSWPERSLGSDTV